MSEINGLYTEERKLFPGQKPCANCLQNNTDRYGLYIQYVLFSKDKYELFYRKTVQKWKRKCIKFLNFKYENIKERQKTPKGYSNSQAEEK